MVSAFDSARVERTNHEDRAVRVRASQEHRVVFLDSTFSSRSASVPPGV